MTIPKRSEFKDDLHALVKRIYTDYPAYKSHIKKSGIKNLSDLIAYTDDPSSWGLISIPATSLKIRASKGGYRSYANTKLSGAWYLSSGTSKDPSAVYMTTQDAENVQHIFKDAFDKSENKDVGLWFTPDIEYQETHIHTVTGEASRLYSILAAYATNLKAKRWTYLIKFDVEHRKLVVNSEKFFSVIESVVSNKENAMFGGFIIFMYNPVLNLVERFYDLSGFSVVTGAGGWTGRKGANAPIKMINKQDFNEKISSMGISDFIDVYGSTEMRAAFSGKYDSSLGDNRYDVSGNVRMIVVDEQNFEPVDVGETGTRARL